MTECAVELAVQAEGMTRAFKNKVALDTVNLVVPTGTVCGAHSVVPDS